jgi:chemotaxis protein methyltransferase CheR
MWRIGEEIRTLTRFAKLNLMDLPPNLGRFDFILCRNVAIYFGLAEKERLLEQLAAHLQPHGTLILDSTETLHGISERYIERRSDRTIYYQLR